METLREMVGSRKRDTHGHSRIVPVPSTLAYNPGKSTLRCIQNA
jgi:hypothetical protein